MKSGNVIGWVKTLAVMLIAGMVMMQCTSAKKENPGAVKENQTHQQEMFTGSWILKSPAPEYKQGFTLYEDGTAGSINMKTLLYRKWEFEDKELVLTSISMGNRSASVDEEKYIVSSLDDQKMVLKINQDEFVYEKSDVPVDPAPGDESSLSTSFEYFPADMIDETGIPAEKHPVDFTGNERGKKFKETILDNYEKLKVNFAGYYVVMTWSCGSACLEGVMVDARDGRVHDLPTKEGYSDIGNNVEHDRNSTLLITSFTSTTFIPNTTEREVEMHYWLWNESAKEFISYKSATK